MNRQPYSADLTDAQRVRLEPLIPPAIPGGRDRSANMREIVNAINDVLRTGRWHLIPTISRPVAPPTHLSGRGARKARGGGCMTPCAAPQFARSVGAPLPPQGSVRIRATVQ